MELLVNVLGKDYIVGTLVTANFWYFNASVFSYECLIMLKTSIIHKRIHPFDSNRLLPFLSSLTLKSIETWLVSFLHLLHSLLNDRYLQRLEYLRCLWLLILISFYFLLLFLNWHVVQVNTLAQGAELLKFLSDLDAKFARTIFLYLPDVLWAVHLFSPWWGDVIWKSIVFTGKGTNDLFLFLRRLCLCNAYWRFGRPNQGSVKNLKVFLWIP